MNELEIRILYTLVGFVAVLTVYVLYWSHRIDVQTQRLLFLQDDLHTAEYRITQLEQEIQLAKAEPADCGNCVRMVVKPFDKTLTGNFRKPQGAENYDC